MKNKINDILLRLSAGLIVGLLYGISFGWLEKSAGAGLFMGLCAGLTTGFLLKFDTLFGKIFFGLLIGIIAGTFFNNVSGPPYGLLLGYLPGTAIIWLSLLNDALRSNSRYCRIEQFILAIFGQKNGPADYSE